ncbi:unnamed protein product [Linum trigynum]|uniref:Uncharacterized protein n=1 Tax=Linum trigynum TaxID=586398 RepID=A0AAV2F585_9ROSI
MAAAGDRRMVVGEGAGGVRRLEGWRRHRWKAWMKMAERGDGGGGCGRKRKMKMKMGEGFGRFRVEEGSG